MKMGLVVLAGLLVVTGQARAWSQQVQQRRNDFIYNLEQYRAAYTDFAVARSQYQTVPTFAHEEKLAAEAKKMLGARNRVWWTYMEALGQEVREMEYMAAEDRDFLTATISAQQHFLINHGESTAELAGRRPLLEAAGAVNAKKNLFAGIAFFAQSRLKQGYMEKAVLEIENYAGVLKEAVAVQERDETVKSIKLRGIEGVVDRAGKVREGLSKPQQPWISYARGYSGDGFVEDVVEAYRPLYREVAELYALLSELSLGLEL
jgi:hypothetical protein